LDEFGGDGGGVEEGMRDGEEDSKVNESVLEKLGRLLQSQEMQLVMLIVIVIDFLSGFYQLYAGAKGWTSPFLSILEYQSGLSLLLFTLELGLVLLSFRGETLSHFGYTLDLVLVSTMFYAVANAPTPQEACWARTLNVLRLWRLVRMVNTVIQATEQSHMDTKNELEVVLDKCEGLKLRVKKAEQAHKREVDKYRRLEQSFRSQRDELETMKEALAIAAQTMARVQGMGSISELIGDEEMMEFDRARQEQETASPSRADTDRTEEDGEEGDGDTDFDDPVSESEYATIERPRQTSTEKLEREENPITT